MRVVEKATKEQTRSQNRRFVLQCVLDGAPLSRADIARTTGLTPPTVSDLLADLIDEGLVVEVGHGPSGGGKPPVHVAPDPDARQVVAISLSDGAFRGSVRNLAGAIVHRSSSPASSRRGDTALEAVDHLVGELLEAADAPVLGIGIATPGVVADGVVIEASNLGWHDVDLAGRISEKTGVPTHVVNDAQSAALAVFTADREVANLLVVSVGEGVGAGIILGGNLYRGDGLAAGEIGHVSLEGSGIECACGNQGCLETKVSLRALVDRLGPLETLGSAADEDLAAVAADFAPALSLIVGALDVSNVVLVGEIGRLGTGFHEFLASEMQRRVLPAIGDRLTLSYGPDSGASEDGAAGLVVSSELGVL